MHKHNRNLLVALAVGAIPSGLLAASDCGSGEVSYLALITPNLTAEIYQGLIDRSIRNTPTSRSR